MATKKKPRENWAKMGTPITKPFLPEYCDKLVEHMRQGNNFKTFGTVANCCERQLYKWLERYPEFVQARNEGEVFLERFYADMGKMMATGQLRRVVKEEPIIGEDGKPMLDPKTGQVMYRREYAQTQGNSVAWIFLCKNILFWRDRRDIELSGKNGGAIETTSLTMTQEERTEKIQSLLDSIRKSGSGL